MTDTTDAYRALKSVHQLERAERRAQAADEWRELAYQADAYGIKLRRNSESHYQLIGGKPKWIVDVYPGNGRIKTTNWRGGYLSLPHDWTLGDVVEAVAKALEVKRGDS